MLGDCFHAGAQYKEPNIEKQNTRSKPIHFIRLHGYLTVDTTSIHKDDELTQGWFTRLQSIYKERCKTISDESNNNVSNRCKKQRVK
jgi:hypothetical protein